MSLLAGVLGPSNDSADLCFVVAWIGLWIIGIVTLIQSRESWAHAVAWISIGFMALAWLFITP